MRPRIVLLPRIAPPGILRVWAGADGYAAPPALSWTVDGRNVAPRVLRPLTSARSRDMLEHPGEPRLHTGVFEWDGAIVPGRSYRLRARAADGTAGEMITRALPDSVPAGLNATFNVLVVSCYHRKTDKQGLITRALSRVPPQDRPHLSVLCGDQVYLDLSFLLEVREPRTGLASRFERDYRENWMMADGYRSLLQAAPSVSVPDDHEYWNDFPNRVKWIPMLWGDGGRRDWRECARRMYEAFQLPLPPGWGGAPVLDVEPLSFFFMDSRSDRREDFTAAVHAGVVRRFSDWVDRLLASPAPRYGVLTTGQPLFEEPARKGAFDHAISNYGDYDRIVGKLTELAAAGRPVLLLTGDKHWGRVCRAEPADPAAGSIFEIMSSPSSLVYTPLKDQWSDIRNFAAGLFGKRGTWPRHGDAEPPPDHFGPASGSRRYRCRMEDDQKGNHIAILSFRRSGTGLAMRVTYYPIHGEEKHNRPREVKGSPFHL